MRSTIPNFSLRNRHCSKSRSWSRTSYIIITPDPNNPVLPVKLNLVDTGGGKLKPGETLWYNFTDHRIIAKLGSAKMTVDPIGRTISKDPAPASGYYVARFAYQMNGNGAFAPITEQSWWHRAPIAGISDSSSIQGENCRNLLLPGLS